MQILDALVALTDDTGADTLSRYFAQLEYTAYCCIRMLNSSHGIVSVIPETGDDVLLDLGSTYELHQVKTRDESAGQWLASVVIEIAAGQIYRSRQLDKPCRCVFVSNAAASSSSSKENCFGFSKFNVLRSHDRSLGILTDPQRAFLEKSEKAWIHTLKTALLNLGVSCTELEAELYFRDLIFNTSSYHVRAPNGYDDFDADNVRSLDRGLALTISGCPEFNLGTIERMYERILVHISKCILFSRGGEARRISKEDVIATCMTESATSSQELELDQHPGRTLSEKKAHLAGFDTTDFGLISKQRGLGDAALREIRATHGNKTADLIATSLVNIQTRERRKVSDRMPGRLTIGPELLNALTAHFDADGQSSLQVMSSLDTQESIGIIWYETNECRAWWHGYKQVAA